MEGFQWLLYKHFKRESCILADDMGLGKTCVLSSAMDLGLSWTQCSVQIASVLGYLGTDDLQVYPSLVVVPNS